MKLLAVGGPRHGEFLDAPIPTQPGKYLNVAVKVPVQAVFSDPLGHDTSSLRVETYRTELVGDRLVLVIV